jgi:hypothetical protein
MKPSQKEKFNYLPMRKPLAVSAAALAFAVSTASANLVFDLRPSAIDPALGTLGANKQVNIIPGQTGNVTFQLWVVITNASAIAGDPFGLQTLIGSVVTQSQSPGAAGSVGPGTFITPFDSGGVLGGAAELSQSYGGAADGILDRGSNSTSAVTNYIKFREDPTDTNGTLIGTQYFVTNTTPKGAQVHQITNGYEILTGAVTLNITAFTPTSAFTVNWAIPLVTSPANRGQIAAWLDGSVAPGAAAVPKSGNTNFADMGVGSSSSVIFVPEPSAFGMVLLGAMGLVGFRRLGFRHI